MDDRATLVGVVETLLYPLCSHTINRLIISTLGVSTDLKLLSLNGHKAHDLITLPVP